MVLVSIIVPVYNTDRYLRQCIESLIQQTIQNIEIICVNDGSTDGSLQILEEYAKKDLRINIISKPNSGYGDSMNVGMAMAKGEYVGIVESDDYALPDMFASLYKEAKEQNADIVKSNYYSVSKEKGQRYEETLSEISYHAPFCPRDKTEIWKAAPSIWSSIYRRTFLEEHRIQFNKSPGASYQDVSFSIKTLLSAEKMVCVPEAYLCYRCDNENSSVRSPKKVYCIMDEFQVVKKFVYGKRREAILPIIEPIKFSHYLSNFFRVDSLYQYAFLDRMHGELQEDFEAGLMEKQYWTDTHWEIMQQIRTAPDDYFESTNPDYLNRYAFKSYTINSLLAEIGARHVLATAKKIIIYGAGTYGHKVLDKMHGWGNLFRIAVSAMEKDTPKEIKGVPVYEIDDLQQYNKEAVIIVAIKKSNQMLVLKKLKELGFDMVISIDNC